MVALLLSAALAPVAYGFGPATKLAYDANVTFEGFIPILGGQEGKVEVAMGVSVEGLSSTEPKQLRAASEIKKFKIVFNGAELPLTLDNVRDYFPRTTIKLTPEGKIVATDAPDLTLPVKLPGLDAKRFPDITYLPIEFPETGVEPGTTWSFKKSFAGSDVTYTCKVAEMTETTVKVDLGIQQSYELLEDEAKQVVTNEKDAVARVKTDLNGTGVVEFDRKLGVVRVFNADAKAVSKATDLKTKETSERVLTTKLAIKLIQPEKKTSGSATILERAQGWWESAVEWGSSLWSKAKGYAFMAKAALEANNMAVGLPVGNWTKTVGGWIDRVFGD